jgi:hypothetical protein
MHKKIGYRTLVTGLRVGLGLIGLIGVAQAQQYAPTAPTQATLYCSGIVTDKPVEKDTYLISGEDSSFKTSFYPGDRVFINQGAEHGVKVGDQFEVIRAVMDMTDITWFKYQSALRHAMGTTYADIGQLRVIHVEAKTSTVELTRACDPMQRGDIVRPLAPRPAPQFHDVKFDSFAPPSGKKTAMVVTTKDFGTIVGAGRIVYVNLGSEQGVRVGDYFRMFRYQGTHLETLYQVKNMAYKTYGFGSTPVAYQWDNLPRQVLGEGIVLRTGPNSSTVMMTITQQEVFVGDYVELE